MREEIRWDTMFHRGRLVDGSIGLKRGSAAEGGCRRHPADESPALLPFSATVQRILAHLVNHVLIQHYRNGTDYISERSDKTIDVIWGQGACVKTKEQEQVMATLIGEKGKKEAEALVSAFGQENAENKFEKYDAGIDVLNFPVKASQQ
ncbi:hypothetical protein FIBSPDRAFT_938091 [Athelia psychrophila]|uniref:Uncharacterized protein n=1 Tax=Athelia psychrophila TaxID=1759441 RepID=A0A165Z7F8_9AGAM|nr:hypothetical protein FIBSPDRAFT_938091 [Fibularhizoctonia sp. CBS 109695]